MRDQKEMMIKTEKCMIEYTHQKEKSIKNNLKKKNVLQLLVRVEKGKNRSK